MIAFLIVKEITGIYRNNYDAALNIRHGFPVFSTLIEANNITRREDRFGGCKLTEEDVMKIKLLGKDEAIGAKVVIE